MRPVARKTLYAATAVVWLAFTGFSAWRYVNGQLRSADPNDLYARWPTYQIVMFLAFRFPIHVGVLTGLLWLESRLLPKETFTRVNTNHE